MNNQHMVLRAQFVRFFLLISSWMFFLSSCIVEPREVGEMLQTALPSVQVPTIMAPGDALATLGAPDVLSTLGVPDLLATPTPAAPAATPSSGGLACLPADTSREQATLLDVIDGDTIDVEIDGETYRVRYIGVDTPERGRPFYSEAAEKNRQLLGDGRLVLVRDVSRTDRYGRLLRYVLAGEVFVNYELALQGYADQVTFPPDVACETVFRKAVEQARGEGRGLWQEE